MGIWPVGKGSRLNRILTIRWSGQLTDGLFQSALASFVLFSPERAPNAVSAALAFSVVLLPYSLIGPYVGTFLDRFSRQRIIRNCNYVRAVNLLIIAWLINNSSTGIILTLFVLFAFGVNRLILSGLSAGLPLLVKKEELIAANALAVTGGTIWVVIGGGIGIAIKNLLSQNADADFADAVVVLVAAVGFLIAALSCYRLTKFEIGPTAHETAVEVKGYKEVFEGFKILRAHSDALRGILSVGIQRGGITSQFDRALGLMFGVNAVDYSGYPDCRPDFIRSFESLANLATKAGVEKTGKFKIHVPLIVLSKKEIIKLGQSLHLDFSLTHTCYDPKKNGKSCGLCDACILRLEGFKEAGLTDPISYDRVGL